MIINWNKLHFQIQFKSHFQHKMGLESSLRQYGEATEQFEQSKQSEECEECEESTQFHILLIGNTWVIASHIKQGFQTKK